MNITKVSFVVKQTTYQKVELNKDNWGIMPTNGIELVDFADNVRIKPERFCVDNKWEKTKFHLQELEIEEYGTPSESVEKEIPCNNEVSDAIEVLKQVMIKDGPSELGSLAHGWHCNLAMSCFDAIERHKDAKRFSRKATLEVSHAAATDFMKKLFDIETTNNSPEKEYNNAKQKTST
jgi:hypothetical protein